MRFRPSQNATHGCQYKKTNIKSSLCQENLVNTGALSECKFGKALNFPFIRLGLMYVI